MGDIQFQARNSNNAYAMMECAYSQTTRPHRRTCTNPHSTQAAIPEMIIM